MEQTPELAEVEARMRPGVLTLHGFLGQDRRSLAAILEADAREMARLGITCEQIAARLERLGESARAGLGNEVTCEGD